MISCTPSTSIQGQCPDHPKITHAATIFRFLAGTANLTITYRQEGFKLTASMNANWGSNSDNDKVISSRLASLSNALISLEV